MQTTMHLCLFLNYLFFLICFHFQSNDKFLLFQFECVKNSNNNDRDSIKVGVSEPGKTYIWKEQGYTSCSASCLGGVEELIINCVREDTGKVVSPFLCSPETKPEARIRTCNDRPCPPRWNYSDFSPCSKSCGIGIRERGVSNFYTTESHFGGRRFHSKQ